MKKYIGTFIALTLCAFSGAPIFAQGTAFTYQGRLNDVSGPANGSYDLRFAIFDAASAGTQQGNLITNSATGVTNGLFTVTLDFGNQFPGAARWLDIAVRTNGATGFIPLSPRQLLTPAPYAITAGSVIGGGLAAGTYGSAVTFSNAGNSFTGNGSGLANVNAVTLGGQSAASFWQLGGNAVAGGQFLGSSNNQPVIIQANNQQVMQFAYASNAADGFSPNIIGGNSVNKVAAGVVGATISGGGITNSVTADFGTVVGGARNTASGKYGIAGGFNSTASGPFSVALGNSGASGTISTALGESVASGTGSTAMGLSDATGDYSMAAGQLSVASSFASVAMGQSRASGTNSMAFGASAATNNYAFAAGSQSVAGGIASVAMGNSTATGDFSTALGGSTASGYLSSAIGGAIAKGDYSVAIGGSPFGGAEADGQSSFAVGVGAQAAHDYSFVWCDGSVPLDTTFSTTLSGQFLIKANSGVGIGTNAPAAALHVASSSVPNAGSPQFQITQLNASDYSRLRMNSGNNQFWEMDVSPGATPQLQFWYGGAGGPRLTIDTAGNVNATSFNPTSDRNAKEHFEPVDASNVLDKVAALPITRWNFKGDDDRAHVGPMAQDFHAAFGLNGGDDKHISLVDEGGVALAAIQGLNQKLTGQLKARDAEIEELKQDVAELKALIVQRARSPASDLPNSNITKQ